MFVLGGTQTKATNLKKESKNNSAFNKTFCIVYLGVETWWARQTTKNWVYVSISIDVHVDDIDIYCITSFLSPMNSWMI